MKKSGNNVLSEIDVPLENFLVTPMMCAQDFATLQGRSAAIVALYTPVKSRAHMTSQHHRAIATVSRRAGDIMRSPSHRTQDVRQMIAQIQPA